MYWTWTGQALYIGYRHGRRREEKAEEDAGFFFSVSILLLLRFFSRFYFYFLLYTGWMEEESLERGEPGGVVHKEHTLPVCVQGT